MIHWTMKVRASIYLLYNSVTIYVRIVYIRHVLFYSVSEVDVCVKTNYGGFVYWGEFPLNFAAVLNQEECYRLILNKGANHDLQDTNGNTITHIMVVYDNIRMFDLAVECGAAINILNNQELTPLSTASFLARVDMFFHIANLEREVYWQIG